MTDNTFFPGAGSPYQRTASSTKGTVVPGMHEQAPGVMPEMPGKTSDPVVGFLYSISRKGIGEYWPVHIGRNTIGRDASCDIVLNESTVSGTHAALNVKVLKKDNRIVAQIRDEGSKNGITVNDEELDFGNHECFDKDLIRIGDNYVLLLILINAKDYGLTVSEDFMAADDAQPADDFTGRSNLGGTTSLNDLYDSSRRAEGGTQSIDGTNSFDAGGTKFL